MVAKQSNLDLISRIDIFKILRVIYSSRLSACQENESIRSGVFLETILQQEKVEESLQQIASGIAPTREEYLAFVKKDDQKKIEEVISFYQNLRVYKQLLMLACRSYLFSFLAWEFYNLLHRKEHSFLITDQSVVWSNTVNFPEEEVFGFVELLQQRLKHCEMPIERWIDWAVDEHRLESEKLNKLFKEKKALYITCFDIEVSFSLAILQKDRRYYIKSNGKVYDSKRIINDALDSYSTYLTFELNKNESLKIFLMVIQKNAEQARINQLKLERSLQCHFNEIIGHFSTHKFDIVINNINEAIQKKCAKNALGSIKSVASLQQFKYWMVGYIYSRERYLRPAHEGFLEDRVYYNPYESPVQAEESRPRVVKALAFNPPKLLGDIDLSKQQAQIWNHSHLPKKAKDHLQLLELLYREKSAGSLGLKAWLILLKIEIFMLTLQYYKPVSFDCVYEEYEQLKKTPLRYMTYATKQYLELLKLAWNEGFPPSYLMRYNITKLVNSFFEVYQHLNRSENALSFGFDSRSIFQLSGLFRRYKNVADAHFDDKAEALLNKAIAKNRTEAISYLKEKLKQDTLAVRFRFSCQTPRGKAHNLKAFKALVTDFLKNVKRRPKAIGARLSGYIGTYLYPENLAVDMVLLFQMDRSFRDADCLAENIQSYWGDYMEEKKKNVQEVKTKRKADSERKDTDFSAFPSMGYFTSQEAKLLAYRYPVMASIPQLNTQSLLVHHYDNALKKIFIKSVVDYFTGYCLISKPDSSKQNGGSGFIKGSLVRSPRKSTGKAKSVSTSSSLIIKHTYHFVFKPKPSFVLLRKYACMVIPQAEPTNGA